METLARRLVAGMLVAAMLGLSVGLRAQDSRPTSHLQAMLSSVPSEVALTEGGWATIRFVDYEALFESEGLSLFRALGNVELLTNAVPLGPILSRIVAGPEALPYVLTVAGEMMDVVGFEWLLDVDRSIEFGDPPHLGLLLGGEFESESIGTALQRRGFDLLEIEGVPVWHRFDDLSISVAEREVADPFGGYLGVAARVALLPEILANARTWGLIEAIILTSQAAQPSLADDPAYTALAEAVSKPEGMLLQALFFSGTAFRFSSDPKDTGQASADGVAALPEFSAAVLADRQEGDDQVHLIGLACADEPTASLAADVLVERLEGFRLPSRPEDVLADRFGAVVSTREVGHSQDGRGIAVVEARYPLPEQRIDPETGLYRIRGLLFRAWVQAILRREFTPLW